jgi:hypothetical protein
VGLAGTDDRGKIAEESAGCARALARASDPSIADSSDRAAEDGDGKQTAFIFVSR